MSTPFPRLVLPVLCLGLLLAAGTASAGDDEPLPPTSQFFEEYDTNADGKVTSEEFRGAGEVFKLLDKDGDGAITPVELGLPADFRPSRAKRQGAGREAPAAGRNKGKDWAKKVEKFRERLKAMDKNEDGKVSQDEWKGPEKLFERLDRNSDGVLDQKDRIAGPRGKGQKRPDGAGRKPGQGAPPAEEVIARIKKQVAEHFRKLDADGDGRLTEGEVPNPGLLKAADKDGDGSVSLEEMQQAMLKRHKARAGGGAAQQGRRDRRPRINAATLKRWDSDGDGKVSTEEFPGPDDAFARIDADKDGFLTEADVKALKKARRAAEGGARPKKRKPDGGAQPKAGLIARMDQNGDGRLHRGEYQGPDEGWKRLDKNQDGWITADEVGGP